MCPRQGFRADGACPTLYAYHSRGSNPQNSLWLPVYEPVQIPIASNSWVEVTHCAHNREAARGQTWAYVAPGSGLSVNVGRTFSFDERDVLPLFGDDISRLNTALFTLVELQSQSGAAICGTHNNSLATVCQALGLFNSSFDSIQRLYHRDVINHNFHHELILASEMSNRYSQGNSSQSLASGQFYCGRHPHRFNCTLSPVPALSEKCSHAMPIQIWTQEHCFNGE